MGAGIWAIFYTLPETGRDDYLSWFHGVHVPEKLSRPGYTWASHYRSFCRQEENFGEYLALFGGESTRTFFDPSPRQLKKKQDEETRRMIGHRSGAFSLIYTIEWQIDGTRRGGRGDAVLDPILWLERFSDMEDAMDLEAWCAQERTRLSSRLPNCTRSRKLLAASGTPRHAVTFEFSETDLQETGFLLLQKGVQGYNVPEGIGLHEAPFVGTRIWP